VRWALKAPPSGGVASPRGRGRPAAARQAGVQGRIGRRVKLPIGCKPCKLSDFPSQRPLGAAKLSEWWSPFEAFDYDLGFVSGVAMAKRFNMSIRELWPILVAVKENWNTSSYLLMIAFDSRLRLFRWSGWPGSCRSGCPVANSELLTFVVTMVDLACQYSRFNDRHWKHADWHALLSDLPARRSVTGSGSGVPRRTKRCCEMRCDPGLRCARSRRRRKHAG
jgi:hypothetical protein